jgi:hypothetical protein
MAEPDAGRKSTFLIFPYFTSAFILFAKTDQGI